MKLYLDSKSITLDAPISGSMSFSYYGDAAKILLTGKINELIIINPSSVDNNYLIIDFIKDAVAKGMLIPPSIVLESGSKLTKTKFEKDLKEINEIWKECSA